MNLTQMAYWNNFTIDEMRSVFLSHWNGFKNYKKSPEKDLQSNRMCSEYLLKMMLVNITNDESS